MTVNILLPKMGLTMEEGEITSWIKKVGDPIEKGEVLLIVQTDKAELEVEAPADGFLQKIVVDEGEVAAVGSLLGYITDVYTEGEEAAVAAEAPQTEARAKADQEESRQEAKLEPLPPQGNRLRISPAARKLAVKNGVDVEQVKGSGPRGRIVISDVVAAAKAPTSAAKPFSSKSGKKIPLTRMRKQIANRMVQSFMLVPQFQLKQEVNVSAIQQLRQTLLSIPSFVSSAQVRPSINDFLIQATALALKKCPRVNASFIEEAGTSHIMEWDQVNIGIAVAIDGGLVVPVIHNADQLSLIEICKKRMELTEKARNGSLSLDEQSGGTFTISNLASMGIDEFVAIVNPPETGIFAVGRVIDKPVWAGSEVQVSPMMSITASFDHRTIDGMEGAKFLQEFTALLQADQWKLF